MITVPVPKSGFASRSTVATVFVCSALYSFGFLGGWCWPSTRSTWKITTNSPHTNMWYSFPYGQGLQGSTMKPGQMYCDNHFAMLSSMHATHKHETCLSMLLFQASIIWQNFKIYLWMEEGWCLWSKERPGFCQSNSTTYTPQAAKVHQWTYLVQIATKNPDGYMQMVATSKTINWQNTAILHT